MHVFAFKTTYLALSAWGACPLRARALLLVACAMLPAAGTWAQQPRLTVQKIVERGDPAPGGDGLLFEMFGGHDILAGPFSAPPNIDRHGNISFHAFLGDDGEPDLDFGGLRIVYSVIDGVVTPVAVSGDPAPGTTGTFFGLTSAPFLTGQGISFPASIDAPSPSGPFSSGIWSDRFGELELVMIQGDNLPGMPAGFGVGGFGFDCPDGESIIVNVVYDTDVSREGFWRDRTGSMELIAIDGMQAPGMAPGVHFSDMGSFAGGGPFGNWFPNRNGELILMSHLAGPGIDDLNNEGIWAENDQGLQLVVEERAPATDAGPDFTFGSTNGARAFTDSDTIPPHLSDNGAALFGARINNPEYSTWRSIWTNRSGELEFIAKGIKIPVGGDLPQADQAPGFPEGWDFSHFIVGFINDNHTVAVWGFVDNQTFPQSFDDPVELGIWWDAAGQLELVAGEGLPVPVAELAGATFTFVGLVRLQEQSDTLWYSATFEGPLVEPGTDVALFRVDPDGSHHIVLRNGDLVDVGGDGDLRSVGAFTVGGGDHVTDDGERLFEIFFNDLTHGIYTADVFESGPVGDLDGDGVVGIQDFLMLLAAWGPCPPAGACPADLDGDGVVGIADLLALLANWG